MDAIQLAPLALPKKSNAFRLIGPQLLADDASVSCALDIDASVERNWPSAADPLIDDGRADAEKARERGLPPYNLACNHQ